MLMNCMDGYEQINSPEKARVLEKVRGCKRCTSWKHTAGIYRHRFLPLLCSQANYWVPLGERDAARVTGCNEDGSRPPSQAQEPNSLFAVYAAMMGPPSRSKAQSALVLEDPGSTDNLITHKYARVLGHRYKHKPSRAYKLCIFDMYGRRQPLTRGFI